MGRRFSRARWNPIGRPALWVAAALTAVAAGYALTPRFDHTSEVEEEVRDLHTLTRTLARAHPQGDYTGLSVRQALTQRWVPANMLRKTGWPVRSRWGTDIDLAPHGVRATADGFVIRYKQVPPAACEQLAHGVGDRVHDLRINGQGVMAADGPDDSLLQRRCSGDSGATMEFVFHDDLVPGTAVPKSR